ncbi:hypothetical protein FA15DRAFT_612696 [Coprinopsis marcescibilis]|uniref:Uncharacterized protein n=1 Tax=Coprinopsis marcescibilis TaxID=230819 RepID=A0A5C3L5X5_COPMA|nr:hypothetical protein FA15DRAFT_612696 [Coprinopsis marcescibilis]
MDNSQHNPQQYLPLSHALNPPLSQPHSRSPYSSGVVFTPPTVARAPASDNHGANNRQDEEDEEEQDDDDDEGLIEKELSHPEGGENHEGNAPSPERPSAGGSDGHSQQTLQQQVSASQPEGKRRPGRPRGSKNRKVRPSQSARDVPQPSAPPGPPAHPDINSQNQQYYEFQWRILNLCAEFYGAAEDLVKGANPLVIAQCYHMGPTSKIDPLNMLADAKRTCDSLLANPAQLVSNPPPPMYPMIPPLYPHGSVPSTVASVAPGSSSSKQPATVPLGSQPGFPPPQYPVYPPGQYPANPYYAQYPYSHPYYPPPPIHHAATTSTTPQPTSNVTPPAASTSASASVSAGIAWPEDEVEKLKRLAEESKSSSNNGEVDWDHVVKQLGDKRTRHQVLIKATALGLKESSSRGVKRRRDNEVTGDATPVMASLTNPTVNNPSSVTAAQQQQQRTVSPSHSRPASTTASPALQHQQRPSSSSAHSSAATANTTTTSGQGSSVPWPMPILASSTSTTTLIPSSSSTPNPNEPQRTSYYRPRPTAESSNSSKASASQQIHHYMYTPANGHPPRSGRDSG